MVEEEVGLHQESRVKAARVPLIDKKGAPTKFLATAAFIQHTTLLTRIQHTTTN